MASASLRQRCGRWYIRLTGRRGEPDVLEPKGGFETKTEAQRELAQVRARLARGEQPLALPPAGVPRADVPAGASYLAARPRRS